MDIPVFMNNAGWRTRFIAFCWLLGSIAGLFAYLTRFFGFIDVSTVVAYTASGSFVFPLVLIGLLPLLYLSGKHFALPLLKILGHYIVLPVITLPALVLDKMGLTHEAVLPVDSQGKPIRKMNFGEWFGLLIAALVFGFYYVGIATGTLVALGIITPTWMCVILAGVVMVSGLASTGTYLESQKV